MDATGLCFEHLADIARSVARREISPVEVVEAHLARCEHLDDRLNAFIELTPELALEQARVAEKEIAGGRCRGPLHGVPLAHKDLLDAAGIRTTCGAARELSYVPDRDAEAVRRLRDAGAVMIGKTNLDEFAVAGLCDNPHYGPVRNPWDLAHSPGGSSGGSAASVAAYLCCGATGSDSGGSIRNPAASCGVTGIKPTNGRVSLAGVYPLAPSMDSVGPLARTVRDLAILLQAMAGYDPADPGSVDVPVPDYQGELDLGVRGLKIADGTDLLRHLVDDRVMATVDMALDTLCRLGARRVAIELSDFGELRELAQTILYAESYAIHRRRLAAAPARYGEWVRAELEGAARVQTHDYVDARRRCAHLRRTFEMAMRGVDALLLPVASTTAPKLDGSCTVNGKPMNVGLDWTPLRMPMNALGVPALSIPTGYIDGLPAAMQIVAAAWREAEVLRVGHAYERATPELRNRMPPHV